MKRLIRYALGSAAMAALLNLNLQAGPPAAGYVDFGKITPPQAGGEFVEVHIKSNLLSMVARLTQKEEPEVADLLRGLQLVHVNVVGLDDKNRAEVLEQVEKVRAQLEAKGWERIVTAQEKNQDVRIYVKTRGEEAVEGLAITVLDGKHEAVLVNIVGDIKPEKLATLGERLKLEPLKKAGEALHSGEHHKKS
jgi:hypothetical protein